MSKYAKERKKHPVLAFFLILMLLVALGAAVGAFWLNNEVSGDKNPSEKVTVEIPKGASTGEVAGILEENGVIGNALVFRAYTRFWAEADGSFQYGSFDLPLRGDYSDIIKVLTTTTAKRDTVTVTFPEGYNAYQMGEVLENAGLCTKDEFMAVVNDPPFTTAEVSFLDEISDDPLKLVRLDGFLFPDTYEFFPDATTDKIVLTMLKNFEKKSMTPENMELVKAQEFALEDWVIFASIIQKEAANVEEMYNVSSVFNNRLKPDSDFTKLESCTTNNYINDYMQPLFGGNAPQNMLEAYDTYGKAGFPVGAIANPGVDALEAALKPNDTPYYFFVTDIEFTHYYGKTWQEHLDNIEKAKKVNKTYGKDGL